MTNKKISALTAATTPLAGTEVLPIVQSSATTQVSIANLTAGRAVSALSLTTTGAITGGNNVSAANAFEARSTPASFYTTGGMAVYTDAAGTGYLKTYANSSGTGGVAINFRVSNTDEMTLYSGGNLNLNTGNLVQGTAGKGITTSGALSLGFGTNASTTQMSLDTSGNLLVGTPSVSVVANPSGPILAMGVSGSHNAYQMTNVATVGIAGTITLTVNNVGSSYTGILICSAVYNANANIRTQSVFTVAGRGIIATFTSLSTVNGAGGGSAFTTTMSAVNQGQIIMTNTSGNATTELIMTWFGHQAG